MRGGWIAEFRRKRSGTWTQTSTSRPVFLLLKVRI